MEEGTSLIGLFPAAAAAATVAPNANHDDYNYDDYNVDKNF